MNKDKLIVALDVPTANEAGEVFEELKESVGAFKIGMQLFTAAGSFFVKELIERGAKIFLDLKFHDIPNTVASAGVEAARLGVWMFNVHAVGGREMMERTAEAVRETVLRENLAQPKIIAVTVLTSSNADTLREVGIDKEPLPQVLSLAKLTKDCGLDGVVASPLEAKEIRVVSGQWSVVSESEPFLIVTPGIRPLTADHRPLTTVNDDQKRILTPAEAVKAGASYLVIGRPILQAEDKIKAVQEILAEIDTANG